MNRTFSYNFTVMIKDLISLLIDDKGPILPTYERNTKPTFEIPLDQIVVTPESSPNKFEGHSIN